MRAVGADPMTTGLDGMIGILGSILVGSALAVGVALALSPLFPIGPVRAVYPDRGVNADWTVLGVGFAILVGVCPSERRSSRSSRSRTAPSGVHVPAPAGRPPCGSPPGPGCRPRPSRARPSPLTHDPAGRRDPSGVPFWRQWSP